ncbi:LAMI_0H05578g1_1 [Lachancea mirantina]|uniref:Required for respiratory growth protein 8, mitochondrial n=1 Tax=Lachancea mirantina TaxID=1230905 RepID=A0A1G4KF35_9SACH|nr:LAMI_0H05578g1_1 [Lachancea mirantina]
MKRQNLGVKEAVKCLLRARKAVRQTSKPIDQSPMIENFHKWAGKKQKLYFQSVRDADLKLRLFGLQNNVYADVLASPMRQDTIAKARIPRDLLLKLKLVPKLKQSKDLIYEVDSAICCDETKGIPFYVVNNRDFLMKNSKTHKQWLPVNLHTSQSRMIALPDVDFNVNRLLNRHEKKLSDVSQTTTTTTKPGLSDKNTKLAKTKWQLSLFMK